MSHLQHSFILLVVVFCFTAEDAAKIELSSFECGQLCNTFMNISHHYNSASCAAIQRLCVPVPSQEEGGGLGVRKGIRPVEKHCLKPHHEPRLNMWNPSNP